MATVPLTNAGFRVLPLQLSAPEQLEPLLDEQCKEWLELFRWDYSGPSHLVREAAREHDLPGFVVLDEERTIGFAFYILENDRCSIGDIYVSRECRGCGVDSALVAAILDQIERSSALLRVESQCVSVGSDQAAEVFASREFTPMERHYMQISADSFDAQEVDVHGISIRPWRNEDFMETAEVVHGSYRGEPDSLINAQYRTRHGCAELIEILVNYIWCGQFMPRVSRVAVQQPGGRLVGALLASHMGPAAGHISQISVLPEYKGLGIGRSMIAAAMEEFKRRDFKYVSLAVTAANSRAFHLYRSCGFKSIHRFPVFFREARAHGGPRP